MPDDVVWCCLRSVARKLCLHGIALEALPLAYCTGGLIQLNVAVCPVVSLPADGATSTPDAHSGSQDEAARSR